jgi:hypothetical protein
MIGRAWAGGAGPARPGRAGPRSRVDRARQRPPPLGAPGQRHTWVERPRPAGKAGRQAHPPTLTPSRPVQVGAHPLQSPGCEWASGMRTRNRAYSSARSRSARACTSCHGVLCDPSRPPPPPPADSAGPGLAAGHPAPSRRRSSHLNLNPGLRKSESSGPPIRPIPSPSDRRRPVPPPEILAAVALSESESADSPYPSPIRTRFGPRRQCSPATRPSQPPPAVPGGAAPARAAAAAAFAAAETYWAAER